MTVDWCDDNDLWADIQTAIFPPEREASAPDEAAEIITLSGVDRGARVLDLCCGPGRHAVAFARLGFQVTGVDLTVPYLAQAEARAREAGVAVEFLRDDMRTFVRPDTFHLITNLYSSFSYFEAREDDLRAVQNMYRSLAPGGVLVMDLMGKEIVAAMFQQKEWQQLDDGTYWLQERWILDGWRRIRNRWTFLRDGQTTERMLEHTLFSGEELRQLFHRAGFTEVEVLGGFDADLPYDEEANRLVVVGRKAQ